MINIFRKTKWKIRYIEEDGSIEKGLIVTAKNMDQAKEKFRQIINDKKVRVVRISMIA